MSTGFKYLRTLGCALVLGAAGLGVPAAGQDAPAAASPAPTTPGITHLAGPALEARLQAGGPVDLYGFYAARNYQPVWLSQDGSLNPAAHGLLRLIEAAELDGVDPAGLAPGQVAAAIQAAGMAASPAALAEAEVLLSRALVNYVTAMLAGADRQMTYEHEVLRPSLLTGPSILEQAASAPSLADYVDRMQWMHPLYAPLRAAAAAESIGPQREVLIRNLERVRGIPRPLHPRHVIVDAGSARLWMYEGDQVVDSMRVVVGTAKTPTPIMSGFIRTAVFNPYWNVPSDMVRRTIAPRARNMGATYLKRGGYQVVSEFSPDAEVLDPSGINWRLVESGELDVTVRQLPSAYSAMGKMKFELPNPEGIYLHDTPDKPLMLKDVRQLSNGCIRLEDAARFGAWLMGGSLPSVPHAPEQRIDVAEPVPIYITYMTAHVDGGQLALGPDPYSLYASAAQPAAVAALTQ